MSTELSEAPKRAAGALGALAERLDIEPKRMSEVLKATAFKACKNDEQFAALIIVANTYGLNPLLKELYAFPGKGGEIVPIVSIDGWLRIVNDHPQMDGMSDAWADDGSWCEVTIYRKDRKHPTVHREYLEEVKRGSEPWKQHPRRMLKWKTIIQTGRIAFGFGGIHDEDEGQAVGMRNVNKSSVVLRDKPFVTKPRLKSSNPVKKAPEGRQTKERRLRDGVLKDIEPRESASGKNYFCATFDIPSGDKLKSVEFYTFSETLNETLIGRIGDNIRLTFTESTKGGFQLESISEVEGEPIQ